MIKEILSLIGRATLGAGAMKEIQKNLGSRHWVHCIFLRQTADMQWVFDIPFAGIEDEPFVEGIPEILEHHLRKARKLTYAQSQGITVLFTDSPNIPPAFRGGTNFTLVRSRFDSNGAWYTDKASKLEGWLCPNIHQFFAAPPAKIHVCLRA